MWRVMLFAIVGFVSAAIQAVPSVSGDTILVTVAYERHTENTDIVVAMTALDATPKEWADATVSHEWLLWDAASAKGVGTFVDEWARMPKGHYRIHVILHRGTQEFSVQDSVVEVQQ